MEGFDMANSSVFISCDWFSISCHLRELGTAPFVPVGWKVQPMGRTSVWGCREYVMNEEGVKVGTLLYDPISPIIKSDRAVIEVSNVFLYRSDFHKMLDILEQVYPFEVDNVQRVDLCADFEMLSARWEVTKMLEDGRCYLKGLRRGVSWWQQDNRTRRIHQLSWGGKDSVFKWKLYYKHKELWEGGQCSKPYIEDMWREAGLEPTKVWRLEVSLTSISSLDNVGFNSRYYREWFDKSVELYRSIYSDKFVIRENQGHRDRRDDDIVTFLDIYGVKLLSHKKAGDREIESDVERRIVTKLWKEFTDAEVRCNDFAMTGLREHIIYMFQKYSNVAAVCRRFKISEGEVMNLLSG